MAALVAQFIASGLSENEATKLIDQITAYLSNFPPEECWKKLTKEVLNHNYPLSVHKLVYTTVYPNWDKMPAPAWFPEQEFIETTNIFKLMQTLGFEQLDDFHQWSVTNYADFWQTMVEKLGIKFDKNYEKIVDVSRGIETPRWLPGAELNIVNSCFKAQGSDVAVIYSNHNDEIKTVTYDELNALSNRVANSLSHYAANSMMAIIMPMSLEAVAIFLGIIKAGYCVVPISDSYSSDEIATRLLACDVKVVFSQDEITRGGKHFPHYNKIIDSNAPFTVIIPAKGEISRELRKQDMQWKDFLDQNDQFTAVSRKPSDYTNILFSSGTTSKPKMIPWTHSTPIKCGTDAYLHHNIQPGDVICWPSNLGWMMGPWLIYAGLLNNATIALYDEKTTEKEFGKFVQDAKVTCLGVIPTEVRSWLQSQCMEGFDWTSLKLLSSTGECSNPDDMLHLMSLTHYRPIIEYCGGTEIGGAYITSTLIQPCAPAAFTTPAMGIDFMILDKAGFPTDNGEVAIIPPSIGLSTELLNDDHHEIYYKKMPRSPDGKLLRRHGDHIEKFSNGFYRLQGRVDDTMNLGGIKVSYAEIEHVLNKLPLLSETAAIAINPSDGGPSQLIIYAVLRPERMIDRNALIKEMQIQIKQHLNPIFKIQDVIITDRLPKTKSNKIKRHILREEYHKQAELNYFVNNKKIKNRKKVCLALQGGGAFGAYTWGILDKFLEDDRLEIDSISATSAGSINAVVMANGMCLGGSEGAKLALEKFWSTLSEYGAYLSPVRQVFPSLIDPKLDIDTGAQMSFMLFDLVTRTFSPYILNPFNFDILRLILLEQIDFDYLMRNSKIKLFLSATNVKSGTLKVFENADITVDAVLASTCLPHLNQAVKIDDQYYWDGGFLGNPAIYPLIYNSKVDDILIIHNNPIMRDTVPTNSTDIANRVNEISFNSSLVRELRAVAFITKLLDKGWIKEEGKEDVRRKFIHIIRADEIMNQFSLINKFNWHWDFISHLRDLGRKTAKQWLNTNFDNLGTKPTIDFTEFLRDDTQTGKSLDEF